MIRRFCAALVFLLAARGMVAQQSQTTDKKKDDSTQKKATSGARELFYLAVAPKDKLPPIPRTSVPAQPTQKKASTSTTPAPDATAAVTPPSVAPAPAVHLGIRYK